MISEKENKEIDYLLRKEMDDLILDLSDSRLDGAIKEVVKGRFKIIYGLYSRRAGKDKKREYMEKFNKFAKGK